MKNSQGKNIHPTTIPGIESFDDFAEFVAVDLRYDKAIELHIALYNAYTREADREAERSHAKNAAALREAAKAELAAVETMKVVWEICKPYTEH